MKAVQEIHPAEQRPRKAIRFDIDLPVRFRLLGEKVWREGEVYKVSSTEILFGVEGIIEPGKRIDIQLVLPGTRKGYPGGTIVSRATIAECSPSGSGMDRAKISASMENPRLLRCEKYFGGR